MDKLNLGHSTTDALLRQIQMPTLHFEHIDPIKLPLVKRFYKQHYPGTKPKSDELIIAGYTGQAMSAIVRFRQVAQYRLLTGMAVDGHLRGQSIGSQLLTYCQQHVLQDKDYCFAYPHLERFYQQAAFKTIDAAKLPAELHSLFNRYSASGKDLIPMQFLPEFR